MSATSIPAPSGKADAAGSRHGWTAWLAHGLAIVALVSLVVVIIGGALQGQVDVGGLAFPLVLLLITAVGWYLAWRIPRLSLGWLLLGLATWIILASGPLPLISLLLSGPAPTVSRIVGLIASGWSWIPSVGLLLTQVPLRFPTGRLPSKRWSWFSRYTIVALVVASALVATTKDDYPHNPIGVDWTETQYIVLTIVAFGVCLAVSMIGSVLSVFVRYRGAGIVERTQLRWMYWAIAIAVGLLVVSWLFGFTIGSAAPAWVTNLTTTLTTIGYGLVPAAIFFAVTRRGLYGIDRIISRTVSYAIVTIVVVGVYVGIVLGIGALLPKANSVTVAIATLAAAAVFLPLLRVVQRLVDRRFNRASYNALKVVEAFGERLRNGADPHTASVDLLTAVEQTLQPSNLGVWTPHGSR